jgi:hypothetical protein
MSKRIETITPPVSMESPSKKKLSRRIHYNKNKKIKWEQKHAEKTSELKESIAPVASLDLVFDPSRVYLLYFIFWSGLSYFYIVAEGSSVVKYFSPYYFCVDRGIT